MILYCFEKIGVTFIKPGQCTDILTIDGLAITSENQHIYKEAVLFSSSSTMHITFKSCARYSRTNVKGFMINLTYSGKYEGPAKSYITMFFVFKSTCTIFMHVTSLKIYI